METGQATQHHCGIIWLALLELRTWATAGRSLWWGRVGLRLEGLKGDGRVPQFAKCLQNNVTKTLHSLTSFYKTTICILLGNIKRFGKDFKNFFFISKNVFFKPSLPAHCGLPEPSFIDHMATVFTLVILFLISIKLQGNLFIHWSIL